MKVFVGMDRREPLSYTVTERSIQRHAKRYVQITPLRLDDLQDSGFYRRPTEIRDARLWDVISGVPMSTEFSLARFWVPFLCGYRGWAMFVDGDWLFRADVDLLFHLTAARCAVMCVKHHHERTEDQKMDGQVQKRYSRKLWSALMLFNCSHEACRRLDLEYLNTASYYDLHEMRWCPDECIGALPQNWHVVDIPAYAYHFTLGTPELGVRGSAFDDEWLSYLTPEERRLIPYGQGDRAAR